MKIEDDTMLETMKKNLNKNPMFRFSLGSKELFHSNFLAWLLGESSICKTVLNILGYEDVKDVNPEKVYTFRELQNIDLLVVIVKDNETDVIMLENKFKSYPYKEQLEKYSSKEETLKEKIVMKLKEEDEKLKKEKISIKKRILLSIQTPYFFNKEKFKSKAEKEWDLLTYKSYIDKLGNIQKNDFETCFEYLSKYIEFTNEIISKLNCQLEDGKGSIEILKNSKNVKKVLNVLSKVKLNDLFQKNIGAKLLDSIQENILADFIFKKPVHN